MLRDRAQQRVSAAPASSCLEGHFGVGSAGWRGRSGEQSHQGYRFRRTGVKVVKGVNDVGVGIVVVVDVVVGVGDVDFDVDFDVDVGVGVSAVLAPTVENGLVEGGSVREG